MKKNIRHSVQNKLGAAIACAIAGFSGMASSLQVEEIVVTAQKRSQNLQDVPIALSVYDEKFIQATGIQSIAQLEQYTPGLETGHQVTQPTYTIRGIGTSDFGLGADPAVGVYIDGVYVGRSGGAELPFSDILLVEVLKGPQGTLFGRNTSAGAIQVKTVEPSMDSFSGKLRGRVDSYDKRLVEGMVNIPVSDSLAFRFNALVNTRDGDIDNANGRALGDEDDLTLRGSTSWNISDRANLRYTFDYNRVDQDAATWTSINSLSPDGSDPFGDISSDVLNNEESRHLRAHSIAFEYELDFATLEYIASYREFETLNRQDDDGFDRSLMPSVLGGIYIDTANIEENEQHYHELRLVNDGDTFQWTAGVSYYKENGLQVNDVNISTETAKLPLSQNAEVAPFLPELPDGVMWNEFYRNKLKTESFAAFGDLTWAVSEQLNITGGIRFTQDKKDFSWFNASNNFIPGANIIFEDATHLIKDQEIKVDDSWTNVSPRFVVDYRWTDNLMTFISLAQGYKAGGFNALEQNSSYDEENVNNIELGMRSEWFKRRVVFNASLYHYKYDDRQGTVVSDTGGSTKFVTTTGDAKANGIDVDITWLMADGLSFGLNYGYLDAEWVDFTVNGIDLKGEALKSPKNQAAAKLDYLYELGDKGRLSVHIDHTYASKRQLDSSSLEAINNISYKTLGNSRQNTNVRISWSDASHSWIVSLWSLNLFDQEHVEGYGNLFTPFLAAGIDVGRTRRNSPRTYGAEVVYNF